MMKPSKINIRGDLVDVTREDIHRMKNLSNRDKDNIVLAIVEGQGEDELPYFPTDLVFSSMYESDEQK